MQLLKSKETINIIFFLILIAAIFSIIYYLTTSIEEGFDTVPIATDPKTQKIVYGYYQVNSTKMAEIPYGFGIDPKDQTKILPITKTAIKNILEPNYIPPIPPKGEKLPDGFYFGSDASLAVLPPNMSPNLTMIDFSGNPEKVLYYYDNSYISETQYYENQYIPENYPSKLPSEVYYVDPSKTLLSFLQYGEIADEKKGYGKTTNKEMNLSAGKFNHLTSHYRDISNNYDAEFHDSAEDIVKQNKMYDLGFDETRVIDQCGNMVSLPKTTSQSSVTYYRPGEFPFGASKYIPNYEDSVYLSSIGYRTMFGNGNASSSSCGVMCQAYNDFRTKMDQYCK